MNKILFLITDLLLILNYSYASPEDVAKEFRFTPARECVEKRLDLPPGVMAKVPVQDQNTSNFCWSYAGTQLIDAWRAKHNPPTPPWTSPVSHAFKYLDQIGESNPNLNQSGVHFLRKAINWPSCSQSVVNDRLSGKDHSDFFNKMQELYRLARSGQASENTLNNYLQNCLMGAGLNKKIQWHQVSQHIQQKEWTGFANQVIGEICKNHSRANGEMPYPINLGAHTKGSGVEGMRAIQKTLNETFSKDNPLPVAVNICSEIFNYLHKPTLRMNNGLDASKCVSKSGVNMNTHASVIVGRRPVKVKHSDGREMTICQYLIRNSYGTSCNQYSHPTPFIPNDRCVNGQIWVDERTLLTNTDEAYYLPDRPQ